VIGNAGAIASGFPLTPGGVARMTRVWVAARGKDQVLGTVILERRRRIEDLDVSPCGLLVATAKERLRIPASVLRRCGNDEGHGGGAWGCYRVILERRRRIEDLDSELRGV